jgi:hypothetical protein
MCVITASSACIGFVHHRTRCVSLLRVVLALDLSITGHDVSHSIFLQLSYPKLHEKDSMENGLKMNCKWPLRCVEMGTVV